MSDQQAQAQRDPRSKLRRLLDDLWPAIKWRVYLLYCGTLYRPHMRFLHRRGKHWWKRINIIGGPIFDRCDWCGERRDVH